MAQTQRPGQISTFCSWVCCSDLSAFFLFRKTLSGEDWMLPMKSTAHVAMRVVSVTACCCSVLVATAQIESPYCTEMCETSHGEIQTNGDCGSRVTDPETGEIRCSGACAATWTFVPGEGCVDMVEPPGIFCTHVDPGSTAEPDLQATCDPANYCSCHVLEIIPAGAMQHAGPTCTTAACPGYQEP